ncbi:hypothetical protein Q2941_10885 [Bradyrhizobium sp. UFLA05-153]
MRKLSVCPFGIRQVAFDWQNVNHFPRCDINVEQGSPKLRNDKLADELLTPLLQACEQANSSHRTIEGELLKVGFGPASVGSVRSIFDKFKAAVDATVKLPFSDAPWRLVRSIALSLNNDSSWPQAADKIIQGLLDHAMHKPPSPGNARDAPGRPARRPPEP